MASSKPPSLSMRRNAGLSLSSLGAPTSFRMQPGEGDTRPISTNMSLAQAALPAGVTASTDPQSSASSVAPAMPAHAWDSDTDTDVDRPPPVQRRPVATMLLSIPCLRVSSMKDAVSFYTDVLGFVRYGPKDKTQMRLFRGAPGATPSASGLPQQGSKAPLPGVHLLLRLPASCTPAMRADVVRHSVQPQSLWLMVSDVDAFFTEAALKLQKAMAAQQGYFPEHNYHEARILDRPQNTPWGTREFRLVDPDGNTLIISADR